VEVPILIMNAPIVKVVMRQTFGGKDGVTLMNVVIEEEVCDHYNLELMYRTEDEAVYQCSECCEHFRIPL